MNIDLKSVFFGALLGGVFVAAVLTYLAPKSESIQANGAGKFLNVGNLEVFDTQTGETWRYNNGTWYLKGDWHQRR